MRIKNTSRFSTDLIREVVQFVRPSGISNFDVMVKNSEKAYAGAAYHKGSGYHATANPFVVIRIGDENKFPSRTENDGQGYIPTLLLSGEEALVHILAHELRHLWQANHMRGKIWGARGRFSERDADSYAIRKVREYRKQKAKT